MKGELKKFWFVKILPFFVGYYPDTKEHYLFKNWVENIVDVYAPNIEKAKEVAAFTGFIENEHYNDIIEVTGSIK